MFLVVCRKPIEDLPWWLRRLLRWVYHHYGWAASGGNLDARKLSKEYPSIDLSRFQVGDTYYSIEYRGVFTSEADARWAASCPGGSYIEVPCNELLPEETAQYGIHDFPLSEVSAAYRNRKLPFVTVPRAQVERLEESLARTKLA